ncbi:lactosylceramide 1,3-N-acetyl-beta-D-glucosaminyltransferase B [Biomphalaria glabrata]|nr:lactosylceramide 1,3-N-acetyl-beta-D-glucosaminyltransferase B [Biomphalaria glabrata]
MLRKIRRFRRPLVAIFTIVFLALISGRDFYYFNTDIAADRVSRLLKESRQTSTSRPLVPSSKPPTRYSQASGFMSLNSSLIENVSSIPKQVLLLMLVSRKIQAEKLARNSSVKIVGKYFNVTSTSNTSYVNSFRTASANETTMSSSTSVPFQRFWKNLTDTSFYDPYIKVVTDSKSSCQNTSSYDAIMAVHTAPNNTEKRSTFRWLYSDYQKTAPYKIKVLFFMGLVSNSTLQSEIIKENQQYGDLVQGSFVDSYRNLTFKAIFVYKWLDDHCRGLKLLLRLDDDVFTDVHHVFDVWNKHGRGKEGVVLCDSVIYDKVRRSGKWRVTQSEIQEDLYNFNHCMGYFAVLSPDLVHKMDQAGRMTLFFWIDDVFTYGFVANKVGAKFINIYRETSRGKEERLLQCLQSQGQKCGLMAFIAQPATFYILYSYLHNQTQTLSVSSTTKNLDKKILTTQLHGITLSTKTKGMTEKLKTQLKNTISIPSRIKEKLINVKEQKRILSPG